MNSYDTQALIPLVGNIHEGVRDLRWAIVYFDKLTQLYYSIAEWFCHFAFVIFGVEKGGVASLFSVTMMPDPL